MSGNARRDGTKTLSRAPLTTVALAVAVVVAAGCASKKILMPPRFDLTPQHRIGLVTFTIENAKGSLHELATQRFMTHVLQGEPGIEVLELGDAEQLLAELGESELGPSAAQKIGQKYGTPAVFFGHLIVSNVTPRGVLRGIDLPRVEANVTVEIQARLLSTESGGTLWSNSARQTKRVAQMGMSGGVPYFSAKDPNDAYGQLVDDLVYAVTSDFRPYWVKR